VFAAATGEKQIDPLYGLTELGAVAANVIARAIARGVYEATALPFAGTLPSWKTRFATSEKIALRVLTYFFVSMRASCWRKMQKTPAV
jgi:hypothetical protein